MSAAAPTAEAETPVSPKKGKKLLYLVGGVVVLALIGGGGALYLLKKKQAEADGEYDLPASAHEANTHAAVRRDPRVPPTFMPLDSMVVNLADPGGNRFAQLGITLQLGDTQTADDITTYLPSIRNGILILVSQRTAEELLRPDGKQALTQDIVAEISDVMGYDHAPPAAEAEHDTQVRKKRRPAYNPVEGVLFSSFIVQ